MCRIERKWPRAIPSALAILLSTAVLSPSVSVASDCTAAKYKAVGAAALRKAKCKATAVRKGEAVDAQCLARAEAKLSAQWSKAESKGDCLTTGDEADLLMIVDSFIAQSMTALEPPQVCCELFPGICMGLVASSAQLCLDVDGTLGAPGEVCDAATGTCQPPPSSLGPCCDGVYCFSGPGIDLPGCTMLGGSFFPSSSCRADQSCGAP